ncbi:MAG: 5-formyltetrahydrofolate cyclo-ligase [Angustibacter sp.]
MVTAKHQLRQRVRAMRRERSGGIDAGQAAERLAGLVLDLAATLPRHEALTLSEPVRAGHDGPRPLAAYVSLPTEPPTSVLLNRCRSAGRPVLLPVLRPDRDLDWALDDPTGTRLGTHAINGKSIDLQLVVVPALAVDRAGHRLGQGGGSYDRALARVPPDVLVVALLHPGELLDAVPHAAHDRPVDAVITADGVTWSDPHLGAGRAAGGGSDAGRRRPARHGR